MFSNSVGTRVEGRLNIRTKSVTDAPHYGQQSLFDLPTRAIGSQSLPTNAHYRQQSLFDVPAAEAHLQIQPVPPQLTVGDEDRFWLLESVTGLRIPGQFSADEANFILEISQRWNWEVDSQTREPACRVQLLEQICCKPQHLRVGEAL